MNVVPFFEGMNLNLQSESSDDSILVLSVTIFPYLVFIEAFNTYERIDYAHLVKLIL